jgi:hypothetical protein
MKAIGFVIICFFLAGCVTVNSVKRDLQEVNYKDGINQKEAVAIARMAMINSKLHSDYQLWATDIYDFGDYWKVEFLSLYLNRYACILIIDKKAGEILAFFEAINVKEAATGSSPPYSIEDWKKAKKFE